MPTKPTVWKAQWPLSTNMEQPTILIYEADAPLATRREYYLAATEDAHQALFAGHFVRVFFEGTVANETVNVDKFVRNGEWL